MNFFSPFPTSYPLKLGSMHLFLSVCQEYFIFIFYFIVVPLADWIDCSPIVRETRVQSLVDSYQRLQKWYLMPPCLTLSIIRYGSRVKQSHSGKGLASTPTPWWCSDWKGRLKITLDCGRQIYYLVQSVIWWLYHSWYIPIWVIILL